MSSGAQDEYTSWSSECQGGDITRLASAKLPGEHQAEEGTMDPEAFRFWYGGRRGGGADWSDAPEHLRPILEEVYDAMRSQGAEIHFTKPVKRYWIAAASRFYEEVPRPIEAVRKGIVRRVIKEMREAGLTVDSPASLIKMVRAKQQWGSGTTTGEDYLESYKKYFGDDYLDAPDDGAPAPPRRPDPESRDQGREEQR